MKKVVFALVMAVLLMLAPAALADGAVTMPTPDTYFNDLSGGLNEDLIGCDAGTYAEIATDIWEGNSVKVELEIDGDGMSAGKVRFDSRFYEGQYVDQRLAGKFRAFHLTNPNDFELYLTIEGWMVAPGASPNAWADVINARFYTDDMLKVNVPSENEWDDEDTIFIIPENFSGWVVLPQTAVNVYGMEIDDVQGTYRFPFSDEDFWRSRFDEESPLSEFYQTGIRFGLYMPDDEHDLISFYVDRLFNGGEGAEIPAYAGDEQLTTPAPLEPSDSNAPDASATAGTDSTQAPDASATQAPVEGNNTTTVIIIIVVAVVVVVAAVVIIAVAASKKKKAE